MPEPTILTTAIAAWQAGLCPIRAATDGTKAPLGLWKQYQTERPDLDDVMAWFRSWPNVGLVMGQVSERLVCIEFEGRFMERFEEAGDALKRAGLYETFRAWLAGYGEITPGGGLHILVHVGGDGPVPGNIKIAQDAEHQTLIETRGEGGFLIVAPSNGTTHPTGGAWQRTYGSLDEIAWCTPDEFDAVVDCLRQFDETPARPTWTEITRVAQRVIEDSWIEFELSRYPSLESVLENHGWRYVRNDSLGQLWVRPGETSNDHSARINLNGRFLVFSSSTPFETEPRSYDALDVDIICALGRTPGQEELKSERVAWLRRRRDTTPSVLTRRLLGQGGNDSPVPPLPDLWLPPEFWSARPIFQAIHDGALLRMLSPEGVFGAFLSCYATTVPMSIVVPPIVVGTSPLNTYCVLVAKSGGGKTGSMRAALELLSWDVNRNPHVLLDQALRSGEGLISAAQRPKTKEDPDPGYRNAVQISFDEGGVLSRQADRAGATVLPYLNTAWAGAGTVGGYKATDSGGFPAALVRVCAVMGVQYGAAANLFTGEAAKLGFPQRLLFFGLSNPVLRTIVPSASMVRDLEPVDVTFWAHGEFAGRKLSLRFPDAIMEDIQRWTLTKTVDGLDDPLDGHRMLLCARTAGLFALMEGRGVVSDDDWMLASMMCATSRAMRSELLTSLGDVTRERNQALGLADAVRADAADHWWLDQRASRIARHLKGAKDGLTLKDIKGKLASSERRRRDEIIEFALARGVIVHRDGRYYAP